KIINAEGEAQAAAALGSASDTMMAHPLALQLRNLQTLMEIGVDHNSTVVFPAPLMSTIGELGTFLAREAAAAAPAIGAVKVVPNGEAAGTGSRRDGLSPQREPAQADGEAVADIPGPKPAEAQAEPVVPA
ncbi:hypothetical protein AB0G28_36270, partial [Amycolatopsis sp. NPDC021455]